MLLLILASISAPMILVSCAKKKEKSEKPAEKLRLIKRPQHTFIFPLNEVVGLGHDEYVFVQRISYNGSMVYEIRPQRWMGLRDIDRAAIKCINITEKTKFNMECLVLTEMQRLKSRHFPILYHQGEVKGVGSFLVMELLDKDLYEIKSISEEAKYMFDDYFTYGTTLKVAQQCLIAIEQLHRAGFVHRQIMASNFACGKNGQTVYMLDFGLARRYVDTTTNRILEPRRNTDFYESTMLFASLDAMDGMEQSRKDDLESWLYMIVDFSKCRLPWWCKGFDNVRESKRLLRLWNAPEGEELFERFLPKRLPREPFTKMFNYIIKLDYYSTPDYKFINNMLLEMMKIKKVKWEDPLDWNNQKWRPWRGWDCNIPYTEPVEVPGDGRPDGFQETPINEQVKLERYIYEVERQKEWL